LSTFWFDPHLSTILMYKLRVVRAPLYSDNLGFRRDMLYGCTETKGSSVEAIGIKVFKAYKCNSAL